MTAERTPSNYRYYTEESIQKLKIIKEWKNQNMSLDKIKHKFQEQENHDMDVNELKNRLHGLEKDVSEIVSLIEKKQLNKDDLVKKQLSHESISLIQSLVILLM